MITSLPPPLHQLQWAVNMTAVQSLQQFYICNSEATLSVIVIFDTSIVLHFVHTECFCFR